MARLEEQLKLRLVVRGAGGLQTTPEGQELYLRVQRAMDDVQEACAHAAQARRGAPLAAPAASAQPVKERGGRDARLDAGEAPSPALAHHGLGDERASLRSGQG
ncbi:hypothetical protein ACMHYB_21220 [Sorangium sp. So ce1128]